MERLTVTGIDVGEKPLTWLELLKTLEIRGINDRRIISKSKADVDLSHPLSGDEIMDADPSIHVLTYGQLAHYKSIDQLLKKFEKIVLLYFNKEDFGHWVALFKNKQGINFFDSYGTMPDKNQVQDVDINVMKKYGQMHPLLVDMLLDSTHPIRYNDVQYQAYGKRDGKIINTCGQHCVVRLINSDMSEKEYLDYIIMNMIKNNMSSDATAVTIFNSL